MSTQNDGDPLPIDSKEDNSEDPDSTSGDTENKNHPKISSPEMDPEAPTITLPLLPSIEHSAMPASRKRPLDEEQPSEQKTTKTWRYPEPNNPLPTLTPSQKTKIRAQAAKDTLKMSKEIVDSHESQFGLCEKFTHKKTRQLGDGKRKRPICPKFSTTQVKVVDTASDIMGLKKKQRVVVLNFANAYKPGGRWLNGASAQEEQICFRTTLGYLGLPSEYYPMKSDEGIYVNNVALMRENEEKGFWWMWLDFGYDQSSFKVAQIIRFP